MVDYREILRLYSENYSQRQIAASVGSSRHTISEILEVARIKGVGWPVDNSVTNEQLQEILFPDKYASFDGYLIPDFEFIHAELAKQDVTLTLLWSEYVKKCEACGKKPYMTTQFGDKYRAWAKVTKATMRLSHKPGDAMEVDWAGSTLTVYDPVTGDSSPIYVFVAVLPCSCFTYAEGCVDMTQENWLTCHIHAYEYFGGVTRLLIPDNLKTGVTKNTKYETILNRNYQDLATYYNTAIVPARVEHPKDKSHAENSVKFVSTWIIAALRNEHFFSVNEAKTAIAVKLEELNDKEFKSKRIGSRRTAFLNEEAKYLKPLPFKPYEISTWLPPIKVGYDYVVSDGLNKYSVPYDLIGKKVDIKLTVDTVEVYYHGSRVASHFREKVFHRDPIVNRDHMPEEHKKYLNYDVDSFNEWGKSIGIAVADTIKHFLLSGKEPEQGFKSCVSLQKLVEKYGPEKVESVCENIFKYTSYPTIRLISTSLKNNYCESTTLAEGESENSFGITRGEAYFRKDGGSK